MRNSHKNMFFKRGTTFLVKQAMKRVRSWDSGPPGVGGGPGSPVSLGGSPRVMGVAPQKAGSVRVGALGWGLEGNVLSARPPPSGDDTALPTHTNTLSSHTGTRKPAHVRTLRRTCLHVRAHTNSEANTHVCTRAYLSKHMGAHPHMHTYTHGTRKHIYTHVHTDTSTDFTGIVCNKLHQATEALMGTESHGWVTGCW